MTKKEFIKALIKAMWKDTTLRVSSVLILNGVVALILQFTIGFEDTQTAITFIYDFFLIFGIIYRIFILKPLPTPEVETV